MKNFGQAKDSYATLDEILNAKMKDEDVRSITKEVFDALTRLYIYVYGGVIANVIHIYTYTYMAHMYVHTCYIHAYIHSYAH